MLLRNLGMYYTRLCSVIIIYRIVCYKQKRHDFLGKKLLNTKRVFYFLYDFCLRYFSF